MHVLRDQIDRAEEVGSVVIGVDGLRQPLSRVRGAVVNIRNQSMALPRRLDEVGGSKDSHNCVHAA